MPRHRLAEERLAALVETHASYLQACLNDEYLRGDRDYLLYAASNTYLWG